MKCDVSNAFLPPQRHFRSVFALTYFAANRVACSELEWYEKTDLFFKMQIIIGKNTVKVRVGCVAAALVLLRS